MRAELARLEHTRRFAMALLVTFMGYDDFRHQVVAQVSVFTPLMCSLTPLIQQRGDSVRVSPNSQTRDSLFNWGLAGGVLASNVNRAPSLLVAWDSTRQHSVSLSTVESEYVALSDAVRGGCETSGVCAGMCVRQLGMACACLCALAGDDVSRRALLHLPATTPAMVALLTAVLPTPTQLTSPAALTAPAMSVLLALSQDLFSQVRGSLAVPPC